MRAIGRHATAPGSELRWRANPLRSLRFRATGIDAVRPFQHVCGRLAGGDARQQRPLFRLGAAIHDGAGGQHRRRKIRCAEQSAPHLLQHNTLIAKAEPVATISFENADRPSGRARC